MVAYQRQQSRGTIGEGEIAQADLSRLTAPARGIVHQLQPRHFVVPPKSISRLGIQPKATEGSAVTRVQGIPGAGARSRASATHLGNGLSGCALTVEESGRYQSLIGFPNASAPAPESTARPSSFASNRNPNVSYYYVNGMRMNYSELAEHTSIIANQTGNRTTGILNVQKSSLLHSLWNACKGIFSSGLGRIAEQPAVEGVLRKLRADLEDGKSIRLHAYSQGSIIIHNALSELRCEMSPEAWQAAAKRIKVTTFGAKLYGWADGVQVEERTNSGDWIPPLMGALSWLRHFGKGEATLQSQAQSSDCCLDWIRNLINRGWSAFTGKAFIAAPNSHDFASYVSHIPEFELHGLQQGSVAQAAKQLAKKIITGEISDSLAENLIDYGLSKGGKGFAYEFASLLEYDAARRSRAKLGRFVLSLGLQEKLGRFIHHSSRSRGVIPASLSSQPKSASAVGGLLDNSVLAFGA